MEQLLEKNERLLKRNAFEAKVLKDTREALLRTERAGARNLNCQNCESLYTDSGHLCKILTATTFGICSDHFYCNLHNAKPEKPKLPDEIKLAKTTYNYDISEVFRDIVGNLNQINKYLRAKETE